MKLLPKLAWINVTCINRIKYLLVLLPLLLSSCITGDGHIFFERYNRSQPIKRLETQISQSTHTHYGKTILTYDLLDLGHSKHFTHIAGPHVSNLYTYLNSTDMTEEKFNHTINRLMQIVIAKTSNSHKTAKILDHQADIRIKHLTILAASLAKRTKKAGVNLSSIQSLAAYLKQQYDHLEQLTLKQKLSCLTQAEHILENIPLSRPVYHARITDRFRMRPGSFTKKKKMHKGIDLAGPVSSYVYAASSGHIKFAGKMGSYGNLVIVDNGSGISTYYAHLRKIAVRTGRKVSMGELIGIQGNTGSSRGEHLHYEIRINTQPVNPEIIRDF